jgi:DNA replication and repair protein RecF
MLESLHLRHFRSHEELDFRPGEGFTVLAGPNGTGKSNLLEGIHYLGAGFPYRQAQDEALVRWGADFFVIRGRISQNGLKYDLEIAYQLETRRKITRINGKRDLPGTCAAYLPVVIFSPADLLLIQGAPSLRRRFLDLVVTQARPQHAADLHDYSGILTQRNNLLRQGFYQRAEMEPWDEQLVAIGARIISRRLSVFKVLLALARTAFASLSRSGELDGAYISQAIPPRPMNSADSVDADEAFCRQAFGDALERRRGLDERLRATTTGPHRDDLCFYLAGHQAQIYCSQGEQRLIALSLKLAQSRLLSGAIPASGAAPAPAERESLGGVSPAGGLPGTGGRQGQAPDALLLLDDVFSELDMVHRERVLQELARGRQVIATTTSFEGGGEAPAAQLTPEIAVYRTSGPERLAATTGG